MVNVLKTVDRKSLDRKEVIFSRKDSSADSEEDRRQPYENSEVWPIALWN